MRGLDPDPLFGGCLARAWARVRARAATRARDPCAYGIYTVPNMTQIVAYLGFIPLHWGLPQYWVLKRGEGLES